MVDTKHEMYARVFQLFQMLRNNGHSQMYLWHITPNTGNITNEYGSFILNLNPIYSLDGEKISQKLKWLSPQNGL